MDSATFKSRYPVFADVADSVVETHLSEQALSLSVEKYASKYNQALSLLTAHELKLLELGDDDFEVEVSHGIEGGSRAVKNIAQTSYELYYSRTSYGSKFLALKSTIRFVGAICV